MNTALFIAKRYLFSKKSHNAINIISGIAGLGVCIGTAALIIVLSVFNGFEGLVVSMFNSFDSDLQITARTGKTFVPGKTFELLKMNKNIVYYSEILEENALLKHDGKQYIATIKGLDKKLLTHKNIETVIVEGSANISGDSIEMAIVGQGVASVLGIHPDDIFNPITLYVPKYGATLNAENPEGSFSTRMMYCSGIFAVQPEFDNKYVLINLNFARELLDAPNQVTSVEIGVKNSKDIDDTQQNITTKLGKDFLVKNKFEQHEMLYKIMRSEKWAVFMILAFILIIATFNVVGSLTMLIIDKQKDIKTLKALGAGDSLIKNIFFVEGMLISFLGAVSGIIIGFFVCTLQQKYGFITLQSSGNFIIDAYPVNMKGVDFISVFITVCLIGALAAWFPAYRLVNNETKISEKFEK